MSVCVTLGVRRPRPRLLVLVGVCASRTLYLSRRAVVCRVASARNPQLAARAAPPRGGRVSLVQPPPSSCPFVVSCRLFTSFVSPLPLLNSCEPNFASRLCARRHSLTDQYVLCAQPRCVYMLVQTACCLWLYLSIRSWSLSPQTLIAESCHIPLLRSVQCQSLAVGGPSVLGPRVAVAAATEAPHMSLCRIFQTTLNKIRYKHRIDKEKRNKQRPRVPL